MLHHRLRPHPPLSPPPPVEMSSNSLYGVAPNARNGEIINMYNESDPERIEQIKTTLFSWLIEITREPYFQQVFINRRALNSQQAIDDAMQYVIWCTSELLGAVIDSLDGKINTVFLQAVGSACFIISLKLVGGYDWLRERGLYDYMTFMCSGTATKEQLIQLESDIMARTDWKGCPSAGLAEENIVLGGKSRRTRKTRGTHRIRKYKKGRRAHRTRINHKK